MAQSSLVPKHSISTEINTVAKCKCKRKAGYFFVAHPVYYSVAQNLLKGPMNAPRLYECNFII